MLGKVISNYGNFKNTQNSEKWENFYEPSEQFDHMDIEGKYPLLGYSWISETAKELAQAFLITLWWLWLCISLRSIDFLL
jgi:hypothetical protein